MSSNKSSQSFFFFFPPEYWAAFPFLGSECVGSRVSLQPEPLPSSFGLCSCALALWTRADGCELVLSVLQGRWMGASSNLSESCVSTALHQTCWALLSLCTYHRAAMTNSCIFVVQEIGKGLGLARSKSPQGGYGYTSNLDLHLYSTLAQGRGREEAKMEVKGSCLCILSFPCYFNFKQ